MADPLSLPAVLPSAAAMPATVKAALPALTVMLVNGARDILFATLILIAGWTVARWLGRWMHDLTDHSSHMDPTLKPLLVKLVRYAILAITFVAVLGQFGVQTTSLIALLGATALAIGLALQGTLSNVASGVMLLFLRPFRVTDKCKLLPMWLGTVREIGLFRTTILTDDGIFVSIPNATIFAGTIQNLSREGRRRIRLHGRDRPRRKSRPGANRRSARRWRASRGFWKNPPGAVEVETLGPLSTTLTVQAWVENRDVGGITSDVKKLVRHALEGADIAAPVPVAAPAVAPWTPPAEKPSEDTIRQKAELGFRRQRDAGRRRIVFGHEEVRQQILGGIDAIAVEIRHAILRTESCQSIRKWPLKPSAG